MSYDNNKYRFFFKKRLVYAKELHHKFAFFLRRFVVKNNKTTCLFLLFTTIVLLTGKILLLHTIVEKYFTLPYKCFSFLVVQYSVFDDLGVVHVCLLLTLNQLKGLK